MDRGRLGRDRQDASNDRVSHSILGLDSAEVRPFSPAQLPDPPATEREPADVGSGSAPRSILGLESIEPRPLPARGPARAGESAAPAAADRAPASRTFLDLSDDAGRPLALSRPRRGGAPEAAARSVLGLSVRVPPRVPAPSASFAHAPVAAASLRREARPAEAPVPEPEPPRFPEIERRPDRAFPIERAILVSLALHFLIVLVLGRVRGGPGQAHPGLLAALRTPQSSDEQKIPIVFHEAPGPERANPKRSDFSDRNRIAGGGDPQKPRSSTPFIPELPGKEGLSPGAGPARAARPPAASQAARAPSAGAGSPSAPASDRPAPEVIADGRSPSSETAPRPAGGASASGAATASRGLPDLNTVIQREAQNSLSRGGEGGAGIPNPEGGFVDSGPLSFETSWYDWGPYAEEMVRRIKLHWDIPKLAELGWKGKLTIHFNIRIDGSVEGATIVAGSGIPPFDFAAMQAILKSNPFRPLPKDLLKEVPGKTKEGITVTFFYNMRPGRESGSEGKS